VASDWTDTFFTGIWETLLKNVYTEEESIEQARFVHRALRLREGSRVADIPCGDGRISIELAKAGCEVVGVDRSAASVRRARNRVRSLRLPAEFHAGDMRRLRVGGSFDAVLNWWGSFGYYDDETNLAVLRRFSELLVPGGRVLIDQVNRERVLRRFMHEAEDDYGPASVSVRNVWNPERQSVDGTWTITKGGRRTRRRSSVRLYTPKQLERMMTRAGLALERQYGDERGSRYGRGSRRMISIGRKR
jgi:SAM-dependent methyltransferase